MKDSTMDIYDKSPNWKHNTLIIGLLVIICFPFGLFLVWTHPTWQQRTKWTITGIFFFFLVFVSISNKQEKARFTAQLVQADSDWSAGNKAEAVTFYKLAEGSHWSKIDDDTKPIIFIRIVEFHADAGQDDEAKKWIASANRRGVSLTSPSPKVTALLTAVAEQTSQEPSPDNSDSSNISALGAGKETGYELNKEFQLGDYKYKIIRLEKRTQIGEEIFGSFIGEIAGPGVSFVIVTYTIENCTNESQVVQADDFQLLDSQGRTFNTSSKVSTALLMHAEDKDFLLSELQPGIPRQMQQGFELPNQALESDLTLIVPKKGLFSLGEARLTIRVR
jgi:hypothetical protein